METEKIVTELYSLRAGLSLIAKEMDKLNGERAVAEERKRMETAQARSIADRQIQQSAARVLPAHAEPQSEDSEYTKAAVAYRNAEEAATKVAGALNIAERKMKEAIENAERTKRRIKSAKRERVQVLIFGTLFILLLIACAGLAYCNFYFFNFKGYIFIPILLVSLAIGIIGWVWWYQYVDSLLKQVAFWIVLAFTAAVNIALMVIGFKNGAVNTAMLVVVGVSAGLDTIIAIKVSVEDLISLRIKKTTSIDSLKIDSLKDECARLEAEYNRLRAEARNLLTIRGKCESRYEETKRKAEKEYTLKCEQIDDRYEKTCAAATEIHTKTGVKIWNTLVKTYGSLLDVRDWKILDLVIWQLETHRAESLREALQLADRETQTDRIVGALRSASEAVRYQIQTGFGRLQLQLNDNFKALANEFASSANYMSSAIYNNMQEWQANQTNSMFTLNRGLEQIVSQSSLQTALLEKAGTSSGKLLEAVNKLRET